MITSVRFPTPITLVKNGNPHTEWAPGKDGVREIRRESGVLVFAMEDGTERTTCLCGGMVIEGRGGDPFVTGRPFVEAKVLASVLAEQEKQGQKNVEENLKKCACGHIRLDHDGGGKCVAPRGISPGCQCAKFEETKDGPSPGLSEIARAAKAAEVNNGPASGPPRADPPPARPIRKGR